MVLRDQGPIGTLGFGVPASNLPIRSETEVGDPKSGAIARYFEDKPILKFLSVSALTIGAAAASAGVARGIGTKAFRKGVGFAGKWGQESHLTRHLQSFREIQDIFDEAQGIHRIRGRSQIAGQEWDDPFEDQFITKKGFHFTQGERQKARDLGIEQQTPAGWTYKDEIKQRLIAQARRLPYELPAAYVTQRAILDPVLGTGPDEPPNWSNPIDVIGDFAEQSLKNLAFAFLPFEAGIGAASHGFRRALTQGAADNYHGIQKAARNATVSANTTLNLLGQEFSDVLNRSIRYSQRTTGAAATAIVEAAAKQRSLPSHMHAMASNSSSARHGLKSHAQRIASGQETFTPLLGMRDFYREFKKAWRDPDVVDYDSSSLFEQISYSVSKLRGHGDQFTSGAFYQGAAHSRYQSLIRQNLIDSGVDANTADDFVATMGFSLPGGTKDARHLSQRVSLNTGERIFEGADDFFSALQAKISPALGKKSKGVVDNIENAIRTADMQYSRGRDAFGRQVKGAWDELDNTVIASQTKAMLGRKKAPYSEFAEISGMNQGSAEFLVRRTAERMGVPLRAGGGRARSTAELKAAIRQRGLDPTDMYQLRSFLVTKGDISKPWNPSGRNIFGLTPMSVKEAIDSGRIKGEGVERFAKSLRYSDWDSTILERLRVGGVYRTSSGGVLDVNPLFAGARRAWDTFASEVQVPFLHMRPGSMLGQDASRDMIRFSMGSGKFMGEAADASGHLWFRQARGLGALGGTRGRAARFDMPEGGRTSARMLEGKFHSITTDPISMYGSTARIAGGDVGRRPATERTGWRKFLAVDEYQPNAFWDWMKRRRRAPDDVMRPEIFASRVVDDSWRQMDTGIAATAASNLFGSWRRHTFGKTLIRMMDDPDVIAEMTKKHPGMFSQDGGIRAMIGDAPKLKGTKLQARIRETLGKPLDDMGLEDDALKVVRNARRNLLGKWSDIEDPAEFNLPLGQARRSTGMHRRGDQARLDLMRYMAIERGMGGSIDDFFRSSETMLQEIGALHKAGYIGAQEAGEATATVASALQMFTGYAERNLSQSYQQNILNVLQKLRQSDPGISLLDETARFGTHGGVLQKVRKYLGRTSEYQFNGLEFNPYGQSHELVPSLGTAMSRNPVKAVASALGFGTWNNADAVSKTGLFTSHLFNRVNKALGVFGARLDETQFRGPLHMLFEGLVAKRMLPAYAAGASFMALDRTMGAYVHNERDGQGERIYQPLITGMAADAAASAQIAAAGVIPGGQTAEEKEHELKEGEVPIRRGRWWPLSTTPWRGGKIEYFRPSWYQRLKSGYQYTDQTYGTPLERLMYGYDFSPLRPLDPYRFERRTQDERPYPISGDYFTGPWGPITPALNMTVGRILKPRVRMHEEATAQGLARFQSVGQAGMAPPSTDIPYEGEPVTPMAQGVGGLGTPTVNQYAAASYGGPAYQSGSGLARDVTFQQNNVYLAAAGSANMGGQGATAYPYIPAPGDSRAGAYTPSNVMLGSPPISPGGLSYQSGELAYRLQEFAGIYGFGFGAMREKLGLGSLEYEPTAPVFAQAGEAYGASRQFWDLNLGGVGDFPTPLEGEYANLELSEIVRRFIPKPRAQDTVNPIPNMMPQWLPGADYFLNFKTGDPYTKVNEGEMRLPGTGYERFHKLFPDETGQYGLINQLQILGDVAPYSTQFRQVASQLRNQGMSTEERAIYEETLSQVEAVKRRHEFTPYKYKYSSPSEQGMNAFEFYTRRFAESLAHKNTFINTKFVHHRTATEDWERDYVYGSNFPQWGSPYRDFIKPLGYRAADRDNPLVAGAALAFLGRFVGVSREAKAVTSMIGGFTGFGISAASNAREAITGERYIPEERKQEMAVEEMVDILSYVKSLRGFNLAQQQGDAQLASEFQRQMESTMYGADVYGAQTIEELARAMPKRKREHFVEMAQAPPQEYERILSTAPRLERRLFQAAWGMRVEQRPELENYFENHELPGPEWEGWDPRVDMEHVKIKMMQREGINLSQMGYYPQQIREANLINPSYPRYNGITEDPRAQIQRLMEQNGMSGSIRAIPTPFAGTRVNINSGY